MLRYLCLWTPLVYAQPVVSEVSSTEFVVMESVQFALTYSLFKTHVVEATSVLYYFLLSNHVNAALLS